MPSFFRVENPFCGAFRQVKNADRMLFRTAFFFIYRLPTTFSISPISDMHLIRLFFIVIYRYLQN